MQKNGRLFSMYYLYKKVKEQQKSNLSRKEWHGKKENRNGEKKDVNPKKRKKALAWESWKNSTNAIKVISSSWCKKVPIENVSSSFGMAWHHGILILFCYECWVLIGLLCCDPPPVSSVGLHLMLLVISKRKREIQNDVFQYKLFSSLKPMDPGQRM